ncbi:MAG: class I SAM-dependent methyltransferase [Candidatus Peribacteraceae bacterium]
MSTWQMVLSYFSGKGLPENFIRHVCITEEDAELILERIRCRHPRNILEVGTFIGLSTGIIASAASEDARLICVDPNLPVSLHRFIGSGSRHCDDGTRTLDHVRNMLNVFRPLMDVILIPGTFSTSFSDEVAERLRKHRWNLGDIPIVGKDIGRYGPFDMVFIDGDHSPEAVESDLCLASGCLSLDGEMLLHDISDDWGHDVNVGIEKFLSRAADFQLARLGSNLGMITRKEK